MRRLMGLILAGLLVAGAAWWGYTTYGPSQETRPRQPRETTEVQPPPEELESVVWASGRLVPRRWANLSTQVGGTVAQIHVAEGDWVQAGDLLLELENRTLEAQVTQARARLAQARAAFDKVQAGPTEAEVAAARAEVAGAQAALAQAEGQLQEAQAALAQAEAQLAIAQAQYDELISHPTEPERRLAEAELERAQAALNQATAAYNQVRGDPNIAARPEALALQQATAAFKAAQAQYDLKVQGPTPERRAIALAQVRSAQAAVALARARLPGAQAHVDAARARLAGAQAALERLLATPTEEDLAMAQADVEAAIAGLANAHAQLRQTQVIAPFQGQVGRIHVRPGELAGAGQPLILLGDTRAMHVETTDLRETDVVFLQEGMSVEVTFDALPEETFQGTVARIAPVSRAEQGGTNYTVEIALDRLDSRLRWGMTAFVNIEIP